MKVDRKFAPVTITLETEAEYNCLLELMTMAEQLAEQNRGYGPTHGGYGDVIYRIRQFREAIRPKL